jgi:hypothetical protein
VILALIDVTAFMATIAVAMMLVGLRVVDAINEAHRAALVDRSSR